jgi:hypothetical protein
MNKFSVSILSEKIKIYKCSREDFNDIIIKHKIYSFNKDILCQTFLKDEITLYMYTDDSRENQISHFLLTKICISDQRIYNIIDIHEDVPGLDHVGIINMISQRFLEKKIPILYVNTFGHNIVLVSEEYMEDVVAILKKISII